jgi:hypothetical protein
MSPKRTDWSVHFEFEGSPTEDQVLELADVLAGMGGIISGGPHWPMFDVRLSVVAPSSLEAATNAERFARKAIAGVGLSPVARIVEHQVQSMDALIAENRGATTDALVGLTEIAEAHRFTRQRAHELSRHPTFPAPVARVGRSPVWRLVDVERWLATPRKPGRPRSQVARMKEARARASSRYDPAKVNPATKRAAARSRRGD